MTEVATPLAEGRRDWLRPLVGIAAAMLVLTIVSTAAVMLVGGTARTVVYGAGSPPEAFLKFASAVQAGDYSTADMYLSKRVRQEGLSSIQFGGPATGRPAGSVSIDSAQVNGDTATLQVSYTFYTSVGFSNTLNGTSQPVQMIREDGGWKVDSELMPL
jgi:hypothetical protein